MPQGVDVWALQVTQARECLDKVDRRAVMPQAMRALKTLSKD